MTARLIGQLVAFMVGTAGVVYLAVGSHPWAAIGVAVLTMFALVSVSAQQE